MEILKVPEIFQPLNRANYPDHNHTTLEEECFKRLSLIADQIKTNISYLPIFWTTYLTRSNFGKDNAAMRRLQEYVSSIREPWFTVSQYDDSLCGIEKSKECISMTAGGVGDVALPLTCYPRQENPKRLPERHLASFVGNLNTYSWRREFAKALENVPGFYIKHSGSGRDEGFEETMLASRFALCPRGYGITSFRLYEAIQMQSIPIYISDRFWLPFEKYVDWYEFCILVHMSDVEKIPDIVNSHSDVTVRKMQAECKRVWAEYFSYEATAKTIKRILEEM
jgi:hypothetical protein